MTTSIGGSVARSHGNCCGWCPRTRPRRAGRARAAGERPGRARAEGSEELTVSGWRVMVRTCLSGWDGSSVVRRSHVPRPDLRGVDGGRAGGGWITGRPRPAARLGTVKGAASVREDHAAGERQEAVVVHPEDLERVGVEALRRSIPRWVTTWRNRSAGSRAIWKGAGPPREGLGEPLPLASVSVWSRTGRRAAVMSRTEMVLLKLFGGVEASPLLFETNQQTPFRTSPVPTDRPEEAEPSRVSRCSRRRRSCGPAPGRRTARWSLGWAGSPSGTGKPQRVVRRRGSRSWAGPGSRPSSSSRWPEQERVDGEAQEGGVEDHLPPPG